MDANFVLILDNSNIVWCEGFAISSHDCTSNSH